MNAIEKLLKSKYPDYDLERYRYKAGDIIRTEDGAMIVVEYSAIEHIQGYVIKRSLVFREKGPQRIEYTKLPYYKKEKFKSEEFKINKRLSWGLYDIVKTDTMTVLLTKNVRHQEFYGYVLKSENEYYLNTHIYLVNPFKDYVKEG